MYRKWGRKISKEKDIRVQEKGIQVQDEEEKLVK